MIKPKYQCIVDQISQDIKSGKLSKGQKIPSVRQLAEYYRCSKDTEGYSSKGANGIEISKVYLCGS